MKIVFRIILFAAICSGTTELVSAQPVSGVWHGKIKKAGAIPGRAVQLELKLVRNGDSLVGSSYYYTSDNNYTAFNVRGYFDPYTGTVKWWDESPLESSRQHTSQPLLYVTDFNCPGEGIMKLDGTAESQNNSDRKVEIHLDKVDDSRFPDDWDMVLENLRRGIFDSTNIDLLARRNQPPVPEQTIPEPVKKPAAQPVAAKTPEVQVPVVQTAVKPPTVEEMFTNRKKTFVTEIPVAGDSIELNFYDHAEIDGDSISLFLNNRLLQKNILLKAQPYTVKLAVKDLGENNELTMVAENLGSIPPNTSLMIAWINGIRYEARLESDENSSAMIRFVKGSKL